MANVEPPPILPEIEEHLKEYLICPEKLPIHEYERNQEYWPRTPNIPSLLNYELSPLCTTLKVQRDWDSGEIIDFLEVPLKSTGANAQNSMLLTRAPVAPSEATRGSASYIPFWPGGFPDPIKEVTSDVLEENEKLLSVPPGFSRGLNFDRNDVTVCSEKVEDARFSLDEINLIDLVKESYDMSDIWGSSEKPEPEGEFRLKEEKNLPEEEEVLPREEVLKISKVKPPHQKKMLSTDWAILLDTSKPMKDFKERVPEMAHEYPFELDTFQKLAILQLEKHNHIFVAAHTSAGKTVVAEYAIALSQKHMTRTIYTSPIKALSNQKYRDFRRTFKDVGLITGDFQINPTAACLIMTTEILRSMLYCGSDVTRDLEYVIFDEVHYINDKERGHVWEQALILLPAHVCVVLLSATVPNTIEFADWLGRTHQKKVYVVSTDKRPVPLKHYLYTGTGGSSKNNRFLVLDKTNWNHSGYSRAYESIKKPESSKDRFILNPKQEKTLWVALVDHLKSNKLLPVVAFTFSRAKCDQNSKQLRCLDLTTQVEKHHIHHFFEECIKNLKEPDRKIPQIIQMREILMLGIGVHHSGVLPIIKEMVEMLFQEGFVKLLFATETFAMGVNMPARTVVFDSITKHDGRRLRNLLPAEYIQMAGRAGRRGLDDEGTVIILCKYQIPAIDHLKNMMLGNPEQLTSHFRLTYGMVLSLLRVENLSVEAMMSRSFKEADHQKKLVNIREDLKDVEKKLEMECNREFGEYLQPLVKFYEQTSSYLIFREEHLPAIMIVNKIAKEMYPGRVLLVTKDEHINKLALLLNVNVRGGKATYKVLVLNDDRKIVHNKTDIWYKMIGLASEKIFSPIGKCTHDVLTISPIDIFEISSKTVKIDGEMVVKDWEKRQIERFRNDPPGQSCSNAIQELIKININAVEEKKIQFLDLIHDLKIDDALLYEVIVILNKMKENLRDLIGSIQIPNFEEHFLSVFTKKSLEDKRNQLKFKLSNNSLTLYPEYESRILLLQELKYVDSQNRVELKGRVACEMGMNELMITELVLQNILTKLKPAEVAALLSCLVFQGKTKVSINEMALTSDLVKGIEEIERVYQEISQLEVKYRIIDDSCQDENLKFGLVEVVYMWASNVPFAEIMKKTDVQEGLIVRCIQQLNETICDVRNAARLIGDPELQSKMEEASAAIKRDIVFAASLYTQREANII